MLGMIVSSRLDREQNISAPCAMKIEVEWSEGI
jgi:hypothetical protein